MRYLPYTVPAMLLCVAVTATSLKDSGPAIGTGGQQSCTQSGAAYMRTTLYFGMTHSAGVISEQEWQTFLSEQVTPRFPQGLTVWAASGQWRRTDGTIGQEQAKVLLLVHEDRQECRAAVRLIIDGYKRAFQQDSVLRETALVCAEF